MSPRRPSEIRPHHESTRYPTIDVGVQGRTIARRRGSIEEVIAVFDTVLVPTDGSDEAESAADLALELAAVHDATVHALSVADTGVLGGVRLPGESASAEEAIRDRAREFTERIADRAPEDGPRVTTAVRSGPAGSEILEYADEVDADLIVMGSRGRGGVHRMALGSVSDHVIRFGDVAVLIAGDGRVTPRR